MLLDDEPLLAAERQYLAGSRQLDMRRGLLRATATHRTVDGVTVCGDELRLLSQADRACGMQLMRFSVDRDDVDMRLEANFSQSGLGMDPVLAEPDVAAWRTEVTRMRVAMAGAVRVRVGGKELAPERPFSLCWSWRWRSKAGEVVELERIMATARSGRHEDPAPAATEALRRVWAMGWQAALGRHEAAWNRRWEVGDVVIDGDEALQRAVRFAVYHLVSAANPEDEHVSIGARALTGDVYFGHVFWDTEVYLLPFFTAIWPEAARALLMYRFNTLPAACAKAAKMGWKGALYAWESADTGEETTPEHVIGDHGEQIEILTGKYEQHISADVAYAVWRYWRATGDDEFLLSAGAEILLETARFWASRATLEADGKRHIRHVIGPDEYHEDVDDNAFTNMMARANIMRALEALETIETRWPERAAGLRQRLEIDDAELADWRDAVERIVTGFDPATGLYEEFAGYDKLEPIDLAKYADRTVPIDVVLGRERTQKSQVIKQADVVALAALLPNAFPGAAMEANFRHYEPRTAHGSSLSPAMHALVAARIGDTDLALAYLERIARTDNDPNAAGGVRIAGLGAIWQAVVVGFGGLDISGEVLAIEPKLPPSWKSLAYQARFRGRRVAVHVAHDRIDVELVEGEPMQVRVAGELRKLAREAAAAAPVQA
jgi:trehalose/maltose hydrolase-like predicted phosphorylase